MQRRQRGVQGNKTGADRGAERTAEVVVAASEVTEDRVEIYGNKDQTVRRESLTGTMHAFIVEIAYCTSPGHTGQGKGARSCEWWNGRAVMSWKGRVCVAERCLRIEWT